MQEHLAGKKTRRCKQTMKMLIIAERNSRAHNKKKYGEKLRTLERTYNKTGGTGKEKDVPILSQFPGVGYTDLDLFRRVKVLCKETVKCQSCVRGAFKIKIKLAKLRKFSQQGGGPQFGGVIPKFYLQFYLKGGCSDLEVKFP